MTQRFHQWALTRENHYLRETYFDCSTVYIARTWKKPKCALIDECIKKLWYLYIIEYYSALKRNESGSFVEMWMDLEFIIQNEVNQKGKNKYCILTRACGL